MFGLWIEARAIRSHYGPDTFVPDPPLDDFSGLLGDGKSIGVHMPSNHRITQSEVRSNNHNVTRTGNRTQRECHACGVSLDEPLHNHSATLSRGLAAFSVRSRSRIRERSETARDRVRN